MSKVVPLRSTDSVPDFVTRVDISKLSDAQQDELLEGIRSRRMKAFIIYQDTVEKKKAVEDAKSAERVTKQCAMIARSIEAIDKSLEKLETQVHKLRGLRIQAGMDAI
jgi:hypothetical protein